MPWTPARPRHPRQVALESSAAALFRGAEAAFTVIGIFLFSGALLPLLLKQGGAELGPEEGNIVLRSVYASIDAISLLLVGFHWRAAVTALSRNKATLALVGLALLSIIWSAAPDLTLRRSFALVGTTAFGVYIAARYDTNELLKLLASALGVAGVLSVLFAVGLPSYGIDHGAHAGAWQGIYTHKNNLAQIMVLSTVAFLLLRRILTRGRIVATCGAALSIGLILLSTSKTAAGVLVMFLALLPLLRTVRWRYTLAVPVLIGCTLFGGGVAVVLLANSEAILVTLGKDPTLTGRTPMWMAILEVIADQPWLGYGYSAFWLGWEEPSRRVYEVIQWETPSAHNGFIDVLAQLGIVGLGIFLMGAVAAFARSVGMLLASPRPEAVWPLIFLIYMVLYNFTETTLLQQHSLYWALYVATVFAGSAGVRRGDVPAPVIGGEPRGSTDARALVVQAHG